MAKEFKTSYQYKNEKIEKLEAEIVRLTSLYETEFKTKKELEKDCKLLSDQAKIHKRLLNDFLGEVSKLTCVVEEQRVTINRLNIEITKTKEVHSKPWLFNEDLSAFANDHKIKTPEWDNTFKTYLKNLYGKPQELEDYAKQKFSNMVAKAKQYKAEINRMIAERQQKEETCYGCANWNINDTTTDCEGCKYNALLPNDLPLKWKQKEDQDKVCYNCDAWDDIGKPEPELIPFDNSELKTLVGKTIVNSSNPDRVCIITGTWGNGCVECGKMIVSSETLVKYWLLDGKPCGKEKV